MGSNEHADEARHQVVLDAYPEWRIVVEYDSVQEHTGRSALLRDSARRNAITTLGFTPVIATVDDLRNQATRLASVIRQIRDRAALSHEVHRVGHL